jgi:hypothetical protein
MTLLKLLDEKCPIAQQLGVEARNINIERTKR